MKSKGLDFTIVYDKSTYTGVTTGDYQDLYNKFKNREFVYGVIMLIESWGGIQYFTNYYLSPIDDNNGDGLNYIEFQCDGHIFTINSDNEVSYTYVD